MKFVVVFVAEIGLETILIRDTEKLRHNTVQTSFVLSGIYNDSSLYSASKLIYLSTNVCVQHWH